MSERELRELSAEKLIGEFESLVIRLSVAYTNPKPGGYEKEGERRKRLKEEILYRLEERRQAKD